MLKRDLCALGALFMLVASPLHAGPKIQTWTTDRGAQVLFYPAPELPMLDVRATFAAGSARDGDHFGVAKLTNGLLAEGAGGLDAQQIAERLERTGARFSNGSLREMAWVSLRTLTEPTSMSAALDTFVQVLTRPDFREADVERLRKQMHSALDQIEQSPSRIAEREFYRALYPGHPYANAPEGTRESVAALSRADVQSFYERHYVARNLTLAIVGDVDRDEAERIAAAVAGPLPAGQPASALPPIPPPVDARTIQVDFQSRQSHVLIGTVGMRRDDPAYFDLYVANHVFGGSGFASRLLSTVREENGLAYSAYSYFVPMAERGPFLIGLQTRSEQADRALALARGELASFVTEGASAAELDASQRNITGGFALRIDSNRKLLQYLTTIGYYGLPLDYLDSFNTRVEAVSLESMAEAMRKRIDPEKMITVVVGGGAG